LTSNYIAESSLQFFGGSDEQQNVIGSAKLFLSDISLFPQDIDEKKITTALYSIEKGTLVPITNLTQAKIIRVDFFQKNLDSFPIYYETGIGSTLRLLIGKEDKNLKVVEARNFHKNISETSSTYAIKSASQAFLELKQGKTFIASNPENNVEVTITKVMLGYYIGEDDQKFLMPVVVFEGDNNFVAYVSAVKDEWISN